MQEITQLQNIGTLSTDMCRDCVYCLVNNKNRECEWDMFEPVCKEKSDLYTSIEFDCINFSKR